ncbi:MAG: helix-turn-helix domain-containing protein [Novosphingobium sp.]
MTIAAHFDPDHGMARETRRTLRLDTLGALATGGAAGVRIHNISVSGLLLETPVELAEGEILAVDLPLAGLRQARVVWCGQGFFGCEFAEPLTQATLSAVELRSEAGNAEGKETAAPDASFGLRLQRLRAERGLTQAQIAAELGVSKPTVWAWEHGKARPVEGRMAGLAEVLGVSRGDLVQGALGPDHGGLIAQSREQIAAAYGIPADRVKIWIEL